MNILALDTTSRFSSIAVLRDDEIQLEYNFSSADNLSALLVPNLDFLLKSLKLDLERVDLLGVAVGPGLYTGIRIGLATIKGLLLGNDRPLVPVVTMKALAFKFRDSDRSVVALIDARRGSVCLACYRFENGQSRELLAPVLTPVEGVAALVEPFNSRIFVGSGAEIYREQLKKHFPASSLRYRSHFLASEVGRIAFQEYGQQRFITSASELQPFYMRPPDV